MITLPLKNGKTYNWGILDAAGLMQHYCATSTAYREMVKYAVQKYPSRKLNLVLYEDGVQPGNVFSGKRKLHAWYFTFREFDLHVRDENAWICFALLQDSIVPRVRDEFSNVSKMLISTLFDNSLTNFATGVLVQIPEPHLISADLQDLQDAEAMRAKWAVKGYGGLRPCRHCTTVFKKGNAASNARDDFSDLSELNWDKVKQHQSTDEDLWGAQDDLLSLHGSKLKEMEVFYGMHRCPEGLLACKELRQYVKPSLSSYDPMHCYFSDGTADKEVSMLLERLADLKYDFTALEAYINSWSPKQCLQLTAHGVKGMASEVLRAVPLLRHFLVHLVQPHRLIPLETESFVALADVVQHMQRLKLFCNVPASECEKLQMLQSIHFAAFKRAYGATACVPKHHFSMHIPSQVQRLGILMDTFVTERKHRLAKEVAEHYKQSKATASLELHMVSRLNLLQLDDMSTNVRAGDLVEPTQAQPNGSFSANKARLPFGVTVTVGEVILSGDACFVLDLCVRDAVGLKLIAKRCTLLGNDEHNKAAKRWRVSGQSVAFGVDAPYT